MLHTDMKLWPGMYFVMAPIRELGALPGDFVSVDPSDENPFILTRILDRHDAETMLGKPGAVQPITPSFSFLPPSQRCASSWQRGSRLRLET